MLLVRSDLIELVRTQLVHFYLFHFAPLQIRWRNGPRHVVKRVSFVDTAASDLSQLVRLGARGLEPVVGMDVGALEGGVVRADLDRRHLLWRLTGLHRALRRPRRLEHSLLARVGVLVVMVPLWL